jgi:hypothetical protein
MDVLDDHGNGAFLIEGRAEDGGDGRTVTGLPPKYRNNIHQVFTVLSPELQTVNVFLAEILYRLCLPNYACG